MRLAEDGKQLQEGQKMAIKKMMTLLDVGRTAVAGCDISYYQGDVDFEIMKRTGIKAVIIRAGYGTTVDKRFVSYINAAIKAGLAIGVYWFLYAADTVGAINNAQKCREVIDPYKEYISLGVWADWEYDSDRYAGTLPSSTRSSIVDAFNRKMETAGYEAGIYSNQDYIQSGKFRPWLVAKYPLWFAKYSNSVSEYAFRGKGGRPYLWQYSASADGKAYGVSSRNLDMNRMYIDLVPEEVMPPAEIASTNPDIVVARENPYPEPTRNIFWREKASMYGDDVKWVQWHLWRFGLFLDKKGIPDAKQIDGVWGAKSDRALEIAQTRLGLKQDKICGPLTREMFKKV